MSPVVRNGRRERETFSIDLAVNPPPAVERRVATESERDGFAPRIPRSSLPRATERHLVDPLGATKPGVALDVRRRNRSAAPCPHGVYGTRRCYACDPIEPTRSAPVTPPPAEEERPMAIEEPPAPPVAAADELEDVAPVEAATIVQPSQRGELAILAIAAAVANDAWLERQRADRSWEEANDAWQAAQGALRSALEDARDFLDVRSLGWTPRPTPAPSIAERRHERLSNGEPADDLDPDGHGHPVLEPVVAAGGGPGPVVVVRDREAAVFAEIVAQGSVGAAAAKLELSDSRVRQYVKRARDEGRLPADVAALIKSRG